MIKNKYFDEYKRAIKAGELIVCKEQVDLVKYLEKNVLSRNDIYFDFDKIEKYIRFSDKNFFKLAKWQEFIASFIFCYWKDTEDNVFDEFLITIARGGGKNGFLSTLGAFFISPLHGIRNYDATITANSENQGKVSFKETYETIQARGLEKQYALTKLEITGRITNSVFRFRTNNPKTMDSARDGVLFFDEIHQFENDKSVDIQRSGLGKIKHPRTFYFGTNGYVREGFYDRQLERAQKVLSGKEKELGYFPFICKLDDINEMDKPELWAKANPMFNEKTTYSNRLFRTVKKEYLKLEENPSGRQEFVIKRMNFTEGDNERDVAPYEQLQAATSKEIPEIKGRSCVAGFDYASIRDFCSVGYLYNINGEFVWKQHSFARKGFIKAFKLKAPIEEWEEQDFLTIVDEPSIDPRHLVNWLVKEREEQKLQVEVVIADGFRMDLLRPILEENDFAYEFMRNPAGVQAKVAPVIEDGFANERFNFCKDPMMRWYTHNTFVKEDPRGNRTFLKKEPVRRKTDGFHAFLAALYKRDAINEFDLSGALGAMNNINF